MLIQNVHTMAQAQPAKLASDGALPAAVVASSNTQAKPRVAPETVPAAAKREEEQQPTLSQMQAMLEEVNKALKDSNKNLEFSVDAETNRSVVKLVDSETGDVIRQFPSEEMLAISRAIDRMQQGLLLKQEA